jgi:hypothetical protein
LQIESRLRLAGLCNNQDASMPDGGRRCHVHVLEVEERAAGDVNLGSGF